MYESSRRPSSSRLERYSGKDLEADFLGDGPADIRYDGHKYKSFREAVDEVLKHQPVYRDARGNQQKWDPENPPLRPTSIPNDLHFLVKEQVEHAVDETDLRLGFYNALGTSLDKQHGIDAFLLLETKGTRVFVSLDITGNDAKISHKADVIVHVPTQFFDNEIYPKEEREALTQEWAKEISDTLLEKLSAKLDH